MSAPVQNLAERMRALMIEARETKDAFLAEAQPHLEALDDIVIRMRDAGLNISVDLGTRRGSSAMPSHLQFFSEGGELIDLGRGRA